MIDQESLKIKTLEQVLIEKVCQLFRNLLEVAHGPCSRPAYGPNRLEEARSARKRGPIAATSRNALIYGAFH
ncbi:hypothetical protein [Methylocystis sp. SC2]|uniref:hypothetical protein n=1 Tax=Methylocystis sp. (strain SC2) TaxID=187303 RepID=UPI00027AEC4F|nr:hypothetical protein [Methylocystis sp. SC2]CCJ06290.1 Hypothetical protein BN69_0839 [Methylocystis sp. SC2]